MGAQWPNGSSCVAVSADFSFRAMFRGAGIYAEDARAMAPAAKTPAKAKKRPR